MITVEIPQRTLQDEIKLLQQSITDDAVVFYEREGALKALEWLLNGTLPPSQRLPFHASKG